MLIDKSHCLCWEMVINKTCALQGLSDIESILLQTFYPSTWVWGLINLGMRKNGASCRNRLPEKCRFVIQTNERSCRMTSIQSHGWTYCGKMHAAMALESNHSDIWGPFVWKLSYGPPKGSPRGGGILAPLFSKVHSIEFVPSVCF